MLMPKKNRRMLKLARRYAKKKKMKMHWCYADGHWYFFLYDEKSCEELIKVFEKFAADPGHTFTIYDASVFSGEVRKESKSPKLPNKFGNRFSF